MQKFRRSLLQRLLLVWCLLLLASCSRDSPPPESEKSVEDAFSLPGDTAVPPSDTASVLTLEDSLLPLDGSSPGTTGAGGATGWKRSELIEGVQEFVAAIDSGDQNRFYRSLSARSIAMVERDRLATREEIWRNAQEQLGDIENRGITVVGGSRDSVALRIDGMRMIDSMLTDDVVVISLLREPRGWKVMYPGLNHPKRQLLR